jgi:hypothetical protein
LYNRQDGCRIEQKTDAGYLTRRKLPSIEDAKVKRVSIKRIVLAFLGTMFVLLSSLLGGCVEATPSPDQQLANLVSSLTAFFITPSPTVTPVPDANALVRILNDNIGKSKDKLADAIDAHYWVIDASYFDSEIPGFVNLNLFVRCECAHNTTCCTPERSFIQAVDFLKLSENKKNHLLPNNILKLNLICSDHDRQIGTITVLWTDLMDYYNQKLDGYQFGNRIQVQYP